MIKFASHLEAGHVLIASSGMVCFALDQCIKT